MGRRGCERSPGRWQQPTLQTSPRGTGPGVTNQSIACIQGEHEASNGGLRRPNQSVPYGINYTEASICTGTGRRVMVTGLAKHKVRPGCQAAASPCRAVRTLYYASPVTIHSSPLGSSCRHTGSARPCLFPLHNPPACPSPLRKHLPASGCGFCPFCPSLLPQKPSSPTWGRVAGVAMEVGGAAGGRATGSEGTARRRAQERPQRGPAVHGA